MFSENKSFSFILSDFWTNVMKLLGGSIVTQIIAILLTPVITYLYSPEDYGILGVFNNIVGFIVILSSLRLERAIVISDIDISKEIFKLCLILLFITTSITLFILTIFKSQFNVFFKLEKFDNLIFLIPLGVFIYGTLNLNKYLGNSMKFYGLLSISLVIHSISAIALKILFGYIFVPSGLFLIFSEISSVIFASVFLILSFKRINSFPNFKFKKLKFYINLLKSKNAFIKFDTFSSGLNYFSWMLPVLMLSYYFNNEVVGYYSLGFMMLRLPMNLLGKAIGDVFYKNAFDLKDKSKIGESSLNMVKTLFGFGLIPILAIFLYGEELFILVFGLKWSEAGIYSQILSFWTLVWLISSPISNLFYILDLQKNFLYFTVVSVILRALGLYIGAYFSNVYLSLTLYSIFSFLIYGYQVVYLLKKLEYGFIGLISSIIRTYYYLFVPVFIMILSKAIDMSKLEILIFLCFVIGATYLFMIFKEANIYKVR